MKTCIYCSSGDNLVAELTLTLDDGKRVSVDVCAVHADDATIKTAKQKYVERQSEIDAILERAKSLGLTLTQERTTSGIIMVQAVDNRPNRGGKSNAAAARGATMDALNGVMESTDDMVDYDDVRDMRQIVSRGGSAGAFNVESHSSIDMSDIREVVGDEVLHGKVKMEVIEKQSGQPVAIPTKKVNGLGTTRIRVVQTTDQEMQRRFKTIAEQSKSPYGWDAMRHLGRDGISITDCPLCRGDCVVRNAGQEITCPKCKGRGMLD